MTEIPVEGYEKVLQCHDPRSKLRAIISIHDTTLGPALGGMRMWPYQSQAEALLDANRLAQGMTYKAAVADIRHGGGKAVILGQAQTDKTADLLRDMGCSGDPAPFTALGVFLGMQVCVQWALHTDSLQGLRIAIQGCGNVASQLCAHLHAAGAELIVTDVIPEKARRLAQQYGAHVVVPEEIYDVPCEVYAPCALGGTLNDNTISRLQCQIIAGSANNQCLGHEHSDALRQRGMVYAPDFVINAGGLINVAAEREPGGYNEARVLAKVRNIARTVRRILDTAQRQDISTQRAALQLAERRLG